MTLPSLSKYRYIVVEGPIGAGKTSLAKKLAERLDGETLLEQPDLNPFLPQFYQDMERYALQTQLSFLLQRSQQLQRINQLDLFNRVTIADFLLDKDPLFAHLTLNARELQLYQGIYDSLKPHAPQADLVIFLQAQPETLIQRVKRRGLAYERPVSEDYLAALAESYNRFFYHYAEAPVLMVNSEHLNFVDQPEHLELLLQRIGSMRGSREFFNVGD